MNDVPVLNTPGKIARLLNVPLHRVVHILNTRAHIAPIARAGRLRLYDSQALAMVRYEINLQDVRGTSQSQESFCQSGDLREGGANDHT
jgi:hypothetical protein